MENDKLDQSLRDHFSSPAPEYIHSATDKHFRDLAQALSTRSAPTPRPRRSAFWFWAGISLSGSLAVAALAFTLLFSPAPTWAQVAERFRHLRFFNATVFFTESSEQQPEKIDLWVAQDRRLRAHYRGFIFFGAEGRINKILSAEKGDEISLDEVKLRLRSHETLNDTSHALALLNSIARLGREPELSLDQLLRLVSRKRNELRLTPNTDASTSSDLQVFDFADKRNPEWMRLWVLKSSDLPARLRIWDPCDGGQTDLLFDYATQMPENAFDPATVQASLEQKQGATNRLYALLPDSGGQPLTPEQLFSIRGYHLPDIDSVGRTPEGVVWVLSRNVENRRPDGERLFGWSQLTDDLGQHYTHRVIGWMTSDDSLLEFFVPDRSAAEFKTPASYKLSCNDTPESLVTSREAKGNDIGSIAITSWRETPAIPDLIRTSQNQIDGRTNWSLVAMDEAADQEDWTKFDKTAASIPGEPETDLVALTRDVKRAHKLKLNQELEASATLCTRLYPLVSAGVRQGQPFYSNIVRWHVADLLRKGQRVEARVLANRHAAEALARSKTDGSQFIVDLLVELRLAGLTETETGTFFERNIMSQQTFRQQLEKLRLFNEQSSEPNSQQPTATL